MSALPAGFDGQFHWDYLKPAWQGTTIEPMDIDAMVERHGAFLLFETKEAGQALPQGQAIALATLARLPVFTIIHCAKRPEAVNGFEVWARGKRSCYSGRADALIDFCRSWLQYQDERVRVECPR